MSTILLSGVALAMIEEKHKVVAWPQDPKAIYDVL
jgi:hypothetical protein